MLNIAKAPQNSGTHAQRGRYFKVQIRAWTDFDPMDKKLPEITKGRVPKHPCRPEGFTQHR